MRYTILLLAPLFAANQPSGLHLISRLDGIVQARFRNPTPGALGMSRIAVPSSMGTHFQPLLGNVRDFISETSEEREVVAALEDSHLQVGLYVFGASIVDVNPEALAFRALKGPGAITRGTPRPAWYPGGLPVPSKADALPDWKTVYPLAKRAMQSFEDGGSGFETTLNGWDVAARPVATDARCATCHGSSAEPVGGVLYAFRRGILRGPVSRLVVQTH
jgi:hypothetical protein